LAGVSNAVESEAQHSATGFADDNATSQSKNLRVSDTGADTSQSKNLHESETEADSSQPSLAHTHSG